MNTYSRFYLIGLMVWPMTSASNGAGLPPALESIYGGATNPPIQAGAMAYKTRCAGCHGENLEGQPNWQDPGSDGRLRAPPHDDAGHTWHHSDADLLNYTKLGGAEIMRRAGIPSFKSGMPAFEQILKDAAIENIIAFIKSRWSAKTRRIQRQRNAISVEIQRPGAK